MNSLLKYLSYKSYLYKKLHSLFGIKVLEMSLFSLYNSKFQQIIQLLLALTVLRASDTSTNIKKIHAFSPSLIAHNVSRTID